MNLDAAIHSLLIRLRTINRAIAEFENIAEGQIANRKPRPHGETLTDLLAADIDARGLNSDQALFEPRSVGLPN